MSRPVSCWTMWLGSRVRGSLEYVHDVIDRRNSDSRVASRVPLIGSRLWGLRVPSSRSRPEDVSCVSAAELEDRPGVEATPQLRCHSITGGSEGWAPRRGEICRAFPELAPN